MPRYASPRVEQSTRFEAQIMNERIDVERDTKADVSTNKYDEELEELKDLLGGWKVNREGRRTRETQTGAEACRCERQCSNLRDECRNIRDPCHKYVAVTLTNLVMLSNGE